MNFRKEGEYTVTINCDGSCLGNNGADPGGWAAILEYRTKTMIVQGYERSTTNNRMELKAAIEGLKVLKRPCVVNIITDSQYLIGVASKGWKRTTNHDMLKELDELMATHNVKFTWVEGHSGDILNSAVNELAQVQANLCRMLVTERR